MRRMVLFAALLAALAATAAPAHAAPACTKAAAEDAVTAADPLVDDIRATGALTPDQEVFDVFGVAKVICADLTGDGDPEMTVLLDCCTAASPTPLAVFRPRGDRWRLAYASTRLLLSGVKRKGRTLRLRHPVYRRTDRLCCPSSYKRYVVRYERGEFVRHSRAST